MRNFISYERAPREKCCDAFDRSSFYKFSRGGVLKDDEEALVVRVGGDGHKYALSLELGGRLALCLHREAHIARLSRPIDDAEEGALREHPLRMGERAAEAAVCPARAEGFLKAGTDALVVCKRRLLRFGGGRLGEA